MKKLICINFKKIALITLATMFLSLYLFGSGDPPGPPDNHGSTQNEPPGGSSSIGSGLVLLLSLGAGYAMKIMNKKGKIDC
jgi:hypothetical protein